MAQPGSRVSLFGGGKKDESRTDGGVRERAQVGFPEAPRPAPPAVGSHPFLGPDRQAVPGVATEPMRGDEMANIGKSISIKGDLSGNEDLVIEGKVEGKVDLPNNQLTIGANGQVKAEINAKGVIVIGRVSGNVHGTERIEIQATGVVEGDVAAPRLLVAEGAVVNGSITMSRKEGTASHPAPFAAAAKGAEELRKVS